MDFNMKQWRSPQNNESDEPQQLSVKFPRLLLDHHQPQPPPPSALPLFVPELTSKLTDLSAFPPDSTSTSSRFPKMGSCYFSLAQWQELELQASIFRHMLAGSAVPPELLHLVKKSLISPSSLPPPPPYYLHHHTLQHHSHYHPALLQSGYWGRAAMDPEPGRCRRTDGKKWRCSRDVVAGQKYCERHVHRGRNRSRKTVEIHTASSAGGDGSVGGSHGGGMQKDNVHIAAQTLASGTHFDFPEPPPSIDLLQLNQRSTEPRMENKGLFEAQNEASGAGKSGAGVLRHFFDDWPPRSLQEHDGTTTRSHGSSVPSSTCLSISTPGNPSSDFSLKLSTGNRDDQLGGSVERERLLPNWVGGWGTHQVVAPMGGPLAEALRSSVPNSSPKSVLHQLPRSSASDTSYVST